MTEAMRPALSHPVRLQPHETLDKEFLSLAEAEGVADIEELNKILERAVNLKNFLKGKKRIRQVAEDELFNLLEKAFRK